MSTDAVAFACGAISSMPAVRGFCIQAFFCLLSILVLELTLFASLIVLDARRVEGKHVSMENTNHVIANRVDCLPCVVLKPKPKEKKPTCKKIPENFGSVLIEKYYVKFLFNAKVRIGVVQSPNIGITYF